ncbi:MAG: hypothetical protein B5M53_00115 [Candidatus Cloacimonas sp. 4484_209]|nr:MAG: hypothetical protein B5M53_00115 [Candidatus Cloacimonas sp. 4484_209]
MNASLLKLYKLQSIDREILEREKMIKEIPIKEEELKKQTMEDKEILEEINQRLTESENKELAIDRKLQETKMNIGKHKKQLLSVKTNKEYAALLKEISTEEKNIERLEEEMITLLDETESIKEEKKEEERNYSRSMEQYEKNVTMLEEKKTKFMKEIEEKKIEREQVAKELEPSLLKRYERIKNSRDGVAVVPIYGENCGGCFSKIPPQVINEVKKGDKILTCQSCGRILVYLEDKEEQHSEQ